MKESVRLHHKPPLQSAAPMVEIMTDRDKVTALMDKPVARGDMGRALTSKPVTRTDMDRALTSKPETMEDMAMDRTSRPMTTRDMVKALGNTAGMADTGDIDMDGVVTDRHIIRE